MNEPLSGPQRFAENMWSLEHLFDKAAKNEDSIKRIIYASVGVAALLNTT